MKKNVLAGAVILLAVIILLLIFVLPKKRGGNEGNNISVSSIKKIDDGEIKNILEKTKTLSDEYVEPEQSSVEKIYLAYEAGNISAEEYVTYTLDALYGEPSSLPSEYKGGSDTSKDHAYMYGLIYEKWADFSENTKEKVRPFLYPVNDSRSYFFKKAESIEAEGSTSQILNPVRPVYAEEPIVIDMTVIDAVPRISIVYSGNVQKQSAEWAAQGIRDAVPKFTGLYGFEHKTAYVSIVGEELEADGEASMDESVPGVCQIKVQKQTNERGVKTTAAHELFHCFQFWYGMVYEKPDTMWLMEATATWSENYVYKDYATEHSYDHNFFPVTNHDLMSIKGNHEYAMYLWYFFLEQRVGAAEIMDALSAGKTNSIRESTQARGNFNREYREFAYWNWNWDPFKMYIDLPSFPDISPYWKSITVNSVEEIGERSFPVDLAKGGVLYNYMIFDNEEIKLIEFYPKSFSGADENSSAGLQVFYKVNGNWNYEDWTGLEKRDFCRELDEENIQFVVLVTSNADLKSELTRPIAFKTSEKCSPGWKGNISVKWIHNNSVDIGFSKGTYTEKGEYRLYETLEYDPDYDSLVVVEQQYFGDYQELESIEAIDKSCGQMWSKNSKKLNGAGFVDYKKTGDMPDRIIGRDEKEESKFGGKYDLYFKVFSLDDGDKFTGTDLSLQMHKSCWDSIFIPEQDGLVKDVYEYTTDNFESEANEVEINIDPKANSFSGDSKYEIYDNVFATVRWDFRKIE